MDINNMVTPAPGATPLPPPPPPSLPYHQPTRQPNQAPRAYPSPAESVRNGQGHPKAKVTKPKQRNIKKSKASSSRNCKTCLFCRSRKTKCDGDQPSCGSCAQHGRKCDYPEDSRRLQRPSVKDVKVLEATIANLKRKVKPGPSQRNSKEDDFESAVGSVAGSVDGDDAQTVHSFDSKAFSTATRGNHSRTASYNSPGTGSSYATDQEDFRERDPGETPIDPAAGPSETEAHVAGAVNQEGNIVVHGVSSIYRQPSDGDEKSRSAKRVSQEDKKEQDSSSRTRLYAYASRQYQNERNVFRHPQVRTKIELDDVEPELAKHLLDIHWNRQHFTYLISYRPAIMDSLMNDGPYANKLLLNGIYYSSSLLSDRMHLRTNPDDPKSAGDRFYRRFRELLIDEIDRSSIPTAVGLLLCGATLNSHGRPSAGWNLCGLAYRMIIDMGCHFTVDTRRNKRLEKDALSTDIELEIRKRLYWGAFLTDASQSLYFGRPPCLRASQARVPLQLLDDFEETMDWEPYNDPKSDVILPAYEPRSACAVTTVNIMVRLFEISTRLIHTFYSMKSLRYTSSHLEESKESVARELRKWYEAVPDHLKYDPETDETPPPHRITPLVAYHSLQILLQRPFLKDGFLHSRMPSESTAESEQACVDAADSIYLLVKAYKQAFTLRRGPWLLCYSIYSAMVAILSQPVVVRAKFSRQMLFFWVALNDLQKGSNTGLQKPLAIIEDTMRKYGDDIPELSDQAVTQAVVKQAQQSPMPHPQSTLMGGPNSFTETGPRLWTPYNQTQHPNPGIGREDFQPPNAATTPAMHNQYMQHPHYHHHHQPAHLTPQTSQEMYAAQQWQQQQQAFSHHHGGDFSSDTDMFNTGGGMMGSGISPGDMAGVYGFDVDGVVDGGDFPLDDTLFGLMSQDPWRFGHAG